MCRSTRFRSMLYVGIVGTLIGVSSVNADDTSRSKASVPVASYPSASIPCESCASSAKGVKGFFQRWRDGVMGTSPADRSRTLPSGLPQGRTYYNGRYFGNFNNRFYGPQYGYF